MNYPQVSGYYSSIIPQGHSFEFDYGMCPIDKEVLADYKEGCKAISEIFNSILILILLNPKEFELSEEKYEIVFHMVNDYYPHIKNGEIYTIFDFIID